MPIRIQRNCVSCDCGARAVANRHRNVHLSGGDRIDRYAGAVPLVLSKAII
jgi:hypothetical protein